MSQSIPTIGDEMPEEEQGEVPVTYDPPKVTVVPGWRTSEGIITAGLGLVLTVMAWMGWVTPGAARDWSDRLAVAVNNIWPLILYVPVLWNYITSRGKLKSNATWANAGLQNPMVTKDGVMGAVGLMGGGFGDIMKSLGGGQGAKDPSTWVGISKIIGKLTGGRVGKTIDTVTSGGSGSQLDPREVEQAFETVVGNIVQLRQDVSRIAELSGLLEARRKELERAVLTHWNSDFGTGQHSIVGKDFTGADDFEGIIAQITAAERHSDK